MGDTLEIFGKEFTNVAGFKAKDENGNTLIYTRGGSGGGGTITIEEIPNATGTTLQITTNGSGGGSGSGSGQTASGTVTGSGTGVLQIPCSFAPDLIYVYGDLSGDVTYRGIASATIIKDEVVYVSADTTTSGTDEFASIVKGITGYNESDTTHMHATYSNGILSIDSTNGSSTSGKWRDGQVYNYELVNWSSSGGGSTPSATQHDIYFEFSDETDATITAYYDDSFISDAITATTPTTYGNKTVTLAQLDSVTWYEPASIPLNTQLIDFASVQTGYAIDDSGNIISSDAWNCVTDYTAIESTMTFSFMCNQYTNIGFYDSGKNAIRTVQADSIKDSATNYIASGSLTPSIIPTNARYVAMVGNSYGVSDTLSLIRTA